MQLFSFLKKEFVKNVLTLITGSMISQIVIYISILFLVRIFSTELFGIYMLFSSATLILKPIATLQYEFALVLPKTKKDAINLFCFSLLCLFVFSVLFFFIVIFFKESILAFFEIKNIANYIYLLPVSVFLFGSVSIFDYWNNRVNLFGNISKGLIAKSTFMSASQIITGVSKFNSWGLIPGMLIGQLSQLILLSYLSLKSIKSFLTEISLARMLFLAKKYKDIPIFNTIINLTNTVSNELPVLLISKYFGLDKAGIYGLAIKFSRAPVNVIQQSVNQVFFNKASKIYNVNGDLHQLIKKTAKKLVIIGFLIFTPLFLLSFYLDFLFGKNWIDVGTYVRILIPWLFFAFISYPINSLIIILNKQKSILIFDIIMLILRFFALFVGYYFYNNIIISLFLFSIVGVIFNIFIFIYLFKSSKSKKIAYS